MKKNRPIRFKTLLIILAIIWTLLISLFLLIGLSKHKKDSKKQAANISEAFFKKDLAFRLWASSHGGVYVPIDSVTPPNEYLSEIEERDIETPSGKKLTLMNPAYIIRQMNELYSDFVGVNGHITSLKLKRPENKPEEWERVALEEFEKGRTDWKEFTKINNEPYLRFMRPLLIESSCLKCHGDQNYKIGDVRGGISISLPITPFVIEDQNILKIDILFLIILWILGLGGLNWSIKNIRGRFLKQIYADQKLKLHIEQNPLGIIEWDLNFCVTNWNKSAEKIFGYSFSEAVNQHAKFIVPEKYWKDVDRVFNDLLQNKGGFRSTNENINKNKKSIYCDWYNTPLLNSEGKVIGIASMIMDLTEKLQYKNELNQSEERYGLLFKNMTAGFALHEMIYDENGNPIDYRYLEINPAFEKLTGAKISDLLGKTVKEVMPNTEQYWIETFGKVAQTGESISYENYAQELGKYYDVWTFSPAKNQFAVMFTDISETKKANLELIKSKELTEESEARFKALHNASFGGIAIHDKGIILECNLGLSELTGYTYEELIGMNGLMLISEEDRPFVIEKINSAYEKDYEASGIRKNGEIYSMRLEARNIPYKGKPARVVEFRDITEQKKLETELKKYQDHLEFVVKERTEELETTNEELTAVNEELYEKNEVLSKLNLELYSSQDKITQLNEELKQSNEELYTVNESINNQKDILEKALINLKQTQAKLVQSEKMASLGILTAGVAHEINNPVNFITSSVYGLESYSKNINQVISEYEKLTSENFTEKFPHIINMRNELDFDFKKESINQIIKNINEGTGRITNIVSSLRTFTIKDDEKMLTSDIHENIDATLNILQHETKNKVEIIKEYAELPHIKCYPGKLNQVFMNLLMNSIQSIKDKGTIIIKTKDLQKSVEVCISIQDNGEGIPLDIQEKIFEPFFTTKKEGQGTGLGLYISYGIIEQHNGRIEISSQVGKGTEFKIFLPYNI